MKIKGFGTAIIAGALLVGGVVNAEPIELRLGTVTPPSHVWTKAAMHFAEEIDRATDGQIKVSVFPGAQLGPESDMLQQMQVGVLDMGIISAAATSARAPAFLAWFSPFTMADVAATRDAAQSDVAKEILDELSPLGIKGMGYVFAGMRHILTTDSAVTSLDDLAGQKIRITPFPGMQVWWSATGAVPTPVQLGDVYQSLSSGLLDGVDIDLDALVGFSMQQVADNLTLSTHMAFPGVAMITQDAWDKMTPDQQVIFEQTMDETLNWAAERQIEAEKKNLATLEGEITVATMDNAREVFSSANDAFAEAFADIPLVAKFQNEIGR